MIEKHSVENFVCPFFRRSNHKCGAKMRIRRSSDNANIIVEMDGSHNHNQIVAKAFSYGQKSIIKEEMLRGSTSAQIQGRIQVNILHYFIIQIIL